MGLLKIVHEGSTVYVDSANVTSITEVGSNFDIVVGNSVYQGATAVSEIGIQVVSTGTNNANLNTVLTERSLSAAAGDTAAAADTP